MKPSIPRLLHGALALLGALALAATPSQAQLGLFTSQTDVGTVLHPGSARFDPAKNTYTLTGSGENMWFATDDFHFVWTKVSGDVALSADLAFLGTGGNNHRKAVLMMRQSLDPGAIYADAARHGDGLTSLQYRDAPAANTHEVESATVGPQRLRLERRGEYAYLYVSGPDGKLTPSGAAMRLDLNGDFYIGLGVCSHDKSVSETAVFSNVKLEKLTPSTAKSTLYSTLETVTVASTDRRVRYVAPAHFEAPNWTRDGAALIFNQDGTLRRWPLDDGATPANRTAPLPSAPTLISTEPQTQCNNDHGLSPDGLQMAISCRAADSNSHIYLVPSTGGTPREVTPTGPSYWHGWSPDGKTLAFAGQRNGDFDIYTIPAASGPETRLTTAPGLDDGPEYSPDGHWIYFNSVRSGHMQIWRMHPDGTAQEQVITSDSNDWFPHLSPDGKWMVFVAYKPGVEGHPPNQDVELRLMNMENKQVTVLARLFGGQGTMNVPSWSPDSARVAFVSYELLPPPPE